MGRVSVKENKNVYHLRREELGLSREKASELLETMPPERIEKIESEKSLPHPDEVLLMSEAYTYSNPPDKFTTAYTCPAPSTLAQIQTTRSSIALR